MDAGLGAGVAAGTASEWFGGVGGGRGMRGGARDARVGSGRGGAGWAARAARPVLALDLSRIRVSLAAGGGAAKGGGTRRHGGTAPRRRCPVSRRTGGLFFPFPPHSPALNRRYAPHRPRRGGGGQAHHRGAPPASACRAAAAAARGGWRQPLERRRSVEGLPFPRPPLPPLTAPQPPPFRRPAASAPSVGGAVPRPPPLYRWHERRGLERTRHDSNSAPQIRVQPIQLQMSPSLTANQKVAPYHSKNQKSKKFHPSALYEARQ